jgi:RNA polymerase sigma-70 factor (ECF subfamily)
MDSQRSTVILQAFLANPQNHEAFGRFAAKFQPRIKNCCLARGLQDADADDLTASLLLGFFERDVFTGLVFERKESFYAWIRIVAARAVYTFLRNRARKPGNWAAGGDAAERALDQLPQAMADDLSSICDEERALAQEARTRVEARLEEQTRQAFRKLVDEGLSTDEVCQALGMTKFAVWKARSRVLGMIRKEVELLSAAAAQQS